ncbi:MAG: DUF2384 domain-containing protein [Opitutaceae bacterium]|nr:DUF2384 domain-containing protein [Opitutaceae bacterium]
MNSADALRFDTAGKVAMMPDQNSNNTMSILTLVNRPATEQIAAIERGFPSQSLNLVVKAIGVSKIRIISGLQLAQRTISKREKTKKRFNPAESERLFRVVRLRRAARELFATDAAFAQWLNSPDSSLAGKSPLEMLTTDIGTAKVENLMQAMIHGVPL